MPRASPMDGTADTCTPPGEHPRRPRPQSCHPDRRPQPELQAGIQLGPSEPPDPSEPSEPPSEPPPPPSGPLEPPCPSRPPSSLVVVTTEGCATTAATPPPWSSPPPECSAVLVRST